MSFYEGLTFMESCDFTYSIVKIITVFIVGNGVFHYFGTIISSSLPCLTFLTLRVNMVTLFVIPDLT